LVFVAGGSLVEPELLDEVVELEDEDEEELLDEVVELEDEDEDEEELLDALEQPTISRDNNVLEINILLFFIKTP
jgi:hypothetical protein